MRSRTIRDAVLTKEVWERTQKTSHFATASNSFQSVTRKSCGKAVLTRFRPLQPWDLYTDKTVGQLTKVRIPHRL